MSTGAPRRARTACRPPNPPPTTTTRWLLLVALDHLGPPDVGRVRVAVRVAQRASLAQQVPALIERDLQLLQTLAVALAGVAARLSRPQLVLLRDELLDLAVDLRIVHESS